jgi:zinc protease
MRFRSTLVAVAGALTISASAQAARWQIPVATKTLPNGLTVVVSEDHSAPTFGMVMVYRIGFRLEPKGRTGFAHLFEHMMFEGTPASPKGTLQRVIDGGGGVNNGSTRYDYTNYTCTAPLSALDPIMWLEADRMKALDFSEKNLANQKEVVKEEIRVNVKNKPYGLFFWTDLSAKAFDKWENAHDGYGSFADLDASNVKDVESFFNSYYGPNNAVLTIVGDVSAAEIFAKAEKYFGPIPMRPVPRLSDVAEPLNKGERSATESDPLARVPAVAVGWKMPARGTKDQLPAAVLGDVLMNGEASRLYQSLVKGKQLMIEVQGGMNWPLGDPWTYNGPTLLVVFGLYKPTTDARTVVAALDEEVAKIARDGVPAEELQRIKTKMESDFYSDIELPLNRANKLGILQLFTGNAGSLNDIPAQLAAVTSADLQRVATTYLTTANRTVIDRQPAPRAAKQPGAAGKPAPAPAGPARTGGQP